MSEEEVESVEVSEIGSAPVAESVEEVSFVEFDEEETVTEIASQSEEYEATEDEYETGSEEVKEEVQEVQEVIQPNKSNRDNFHVQKDTRQPSPNVDNLRKRSLSVSSRTRGKSGSIRLGADDGKSFDGGATARGSRASVYDPNRTSISRRKTVQIAREVSVAKEKKPSKDEPPAEDDDDSGEWACPVKPVKPRPKVVPPPHQLWPVRKFNHHIVNKLIADALPRFFVNHIYHPTSSVDNLRMALTYIVRKVYQLRYDRRKLVVIGRLHENLGQSSLAIARFFWNPDTDAYAHYTLHKPGFIVGVVVFAIYMD